MAGLGKKGPHYVPERAARLLDKLSKAALMDIAWNLALLGTDETPEQVLTHVAREAIIVAEGRGDAVPAGLKDAAAWPIDSDPLDDESRDRESMEAEQALVRGLPRGPLCTMCSAAAVPAPGDLCADCLKTWGGKGDQT